ncbi:hypothetical protein NWP21_06270, partial [Anabaenopsis sp. FSS-46]|uniref:hypothetical protein n=1 Tax=Anabaenopsis sp. FSS-46 TaxID=2971766 RepID=UPI002476B282
EIPIQRKLDTTSPSISLPVVTADNSLTNQSSQDIPLVNVVNPNSSIGDTTSTSEIPIQRKLDTTSSPSISLPVVSAENFFPNQSSQDIPLVLDTTSSPSISLPVVQPENSFPNQSLQDIPLVNLVNPNSSLGKTTSTSEILIQGKLDTTSSPSISLPVVTADNSFPNQSLQDIPLVNLVNPNSPIGKTTSSSNISLPVVQPENSFPNQSLQDIPLVERLSPSINIQHYTSTLTTPIKPKLENRNTVVVDCGDKKPKSAYNQEILLKVKVNSEPYSPELEPLIWSNYPIAKEKVNNLNSEQIAHQKNLISKDNHHSTSSHQSPNHISNIIPVNETTNISYSSVNSHPPPINQSQKTSLEGVSIPPQINVDDLVEKVERRIMRRLVIESERRGKRKWR